MISPEWMKPGIYGAAVGAIAIIVVGFAWGGWSTRSGADEMAQELAADEVIKAMVPVCLYMSDADPERAAKRANLQALSEFDRRNAMLETGWATPPGTDKPDRTLAEACLAELELDGA